MALAFITDIPTKVFVTSLEEIAISTTSAVSVNISANGTNLLTETYYPNKNVVRIHNVDELILPYLGKPVLEIPCRIHVLDNAGGVLDKSFITVYTAFKIPMTYDEFCHSHFFTACNGRKVSYMNSHEELTFKNNVVAYGYITREYYNPKDGSIELEQNDTGSIEPGTHTIDVSPHQYSAVGLVLVSVHVLMGSADISYSILDAPMVAPLIFRFRNGFGYTDYISLEGLLTTSKDFSRTSAYLNSQYINLYNRETHIHELKTAPIRDYMVSSIEDLLRSDDVVWLDGDKEIPVSIIESESVSSNDPTEMVSYKFKFRSKTKYQAIL